MIYDQADVSRIFPFDLIKFKYKYIIWKRDETSGLHG